MSKFMKLEVKGKEYFIGFSNRASVLKAERKGFMKALNEFDNAPVEGTAKLLQLGLLEKQPDITLAECNKILEEAEKKITILVNENGEMEVNLSLGELTTANVKVEVMAKSLTKDKTITNKGKITHDKIGEIESNSITHVVELFDKNNVDPDKTS